MDVNLHKGAMKAVHISRKSAFDRQIDPKTRQL